MKTLIAYMSTHGCTESIAKELKKKLGEEAIIINLKKEAAPDLNLFDRVIIGGSIHAGQIQKKVKEFCKNYLDNLIDKEVGLFICCMYEGETAQRQLKDAFPPELHEVAKAEAIFGGAFDFEKMNFLERMITKKVAHVNESISNVDYDKVNKFARRMDKIFNPFLFLV